MQETHGLTGAQHAGMKHTETVEQEIGRKGLTAPRVTPADIESAIEHAFFVNAANAVTGQAILDREPSPIGKASPLHLLTLCIAQMRNGFTVVGKSACASPENYDEALGRRIALEDAKRQMWPLLGYALRDRLTNQPHKE